MLFPKLNPHLYERLLAASFQTPNVLRPLSVLWFFVSCRPQRGYPLCQFHHHQGQRRRIGLLLFLTIGHESMMHCTDGRMLPIEQGALAASSIFRSSERPWLILNPQHMQVFCAPESCQTNPPTCSKTVNNLPLSLTLGTGNKRQRWQRLNKRPVPFASGSSRV